MGLDNFWRNTDASAPKMENVNLCGGICSDMLGGDQNCFRGKVYSNFIFQITLESLYQEVIPNDKIKEMAAKLSLFLVENEGRIIIDEYQRKFNPEEIKDLVKMFNYHAEYGSELRGWW